MYLLARYHYCIAVHTIQCEKASSLLEKDQCFALFRSVLCDFQDILFFPCGNPHPL